jgi:penicillin-binding protein 1A
LRNIFRFLFWTAFNLALLAFLAVLYLFYINSKDLPSYQQLEVYQPPIVTRFYSADGKLLEEYAKEHRLFLPINDIPDLVKHAFISAEDKNFYTHVGIDFAGILRSAIKNIISSSQGKRSLVGGSTITQQVVKNFLLTNEKSINRKIKEAILSYRITQVFSKDKILELYLNQIFLGARSYGVASAALNYFNKSLNELNLEEAAFLAALPQAPSYYNPHKNIDRALSRRNWVIDRMYDEGYLTKDMAIKAVAQPIKLHNREKEEVVDADFFAESVRQNIAEIYGDQSLYESGLMVRTSLNPKLQEFGDNALRNGIISYDQRHGYRGAIAKTKPNEDWAQKLKDMSQNGVNIDPWQYAAILQVGDKEVKLGLKDGRFASLNIQGSKWALAGRQINKVLAAGDVIVVDKDNNLKQIPKVNGALVAMDPHTGRVLAMSGGYSFDNSKFNRATQAFRQPGSSFKPFVYLAALENGVAPNRIFEDSPIALEQGPGLPLWKPKNFYNDFLGPITFRRGLEFSRNPITVRVAQSIGIQKVVDIAKRFGITHNPPPYYSMVLGSMETTLLRLTNAYAVVANGGHKVTPSLIDKVQDRHGKVIYSGDKRACINCSSNNEMVPFIQENDLFVTDPRSAYQMVSLLEGVVAHAKSSGPLRDMGKTIAGKTGTSNEAKDVWFIGFSADLVVGVFVGFDEPRSLGKRESGAMVAQPVFVEFMKKALADQPDKPFKMPDGLKLVKIDYLTGESTTSRTGSIYEVFKKANYKEPTEIKKAELDAEPEPNKSEGQDLNQFNLDEIQDEGIY